ncbi:tetratricopeptide repeat protein [Candidatus Latescibacterota bacterium]
MSVNLKYYILLSIIAAVFFIASCKSPRYQVKEFKPRIRQHLSEADKYFNEGLAMYMLKRLQESADAFERAVEGNPADGEAYFRLGLAYAGLQKIDEAISAFDKAFSLGGEYGASLEQMAIVYRIHGDREKEIEVLEEAIAIGEPHPTLLLHRLGIAYYAVDRQEDAIQALNSGISESPSASASYGTYYYLGSIYLKQNNYDEAIRFLERQIQDNSEFSAIVSTYFNLGLAYHRNTEYQRAIPPFEQVVARKPDYTEAYYNLATAYWLAGQREKSLAILEKLEYMDKKFSAQLKIFYENYHDTRSTE